MELILLSIEKYQPLVNLLQNMVVILGVISIVIGIRGYKSSNANNLAQLFLELRAGYQERHRQLRKEIPDLDSKLAEQDVKSFKRLTTTQDEALESYWIHSFNEWYTLNKIFLNEGGGNLWREFYQPAIASSLRTPFYRIKLQKMFSSDYSFGESENEFRAVILQLAEDLKNKKFQTKIKPEDLPGLTYFLQNTQKISK